MSGEGERLALQARLDAARTGVERNRLGQFATPPPLAHLPAGQPLRFLAPAFGTGAFHAALLAARQPEVAAGFEIDPDTCAPAQALWRGHPLDRALGDFTQAPPPAEKRRLTAAGEQASGVRFPRSLMARRKPN